MRNVTSTVYYINSLPDWFYIKDSVKTMSSYWWVTDIVVLHTDPKRPDYFGESEEEYFKVTEHWKDFGSGFDKSVHELAPKNKELIDIRKSLQE